MRRLPPSTASEQQIIQDVTEDQRLYGASKLSWDSVTIQEIYFTSLVCFYLSPIWRRQVKYILAEITNPKFVSRVFTILKAYNTHYPQTLDSSKQKVMGRMEVSHVIELTHHVSKITVKEKQDDKIIDLISV